ncbi:MAG: hypothetical protein V7K95_23825 [Nostoc sp.]
MPKTWNIKIDNYFQVNSNKEESEVKVTQGSSKRGKGKRDELNATTVTK